MDLGISGRNALVTAGSKGLGRAIALRLAHEGVRVAVSARGHEAIKATVSEVTQTGGHAEGVVADISTADGCAHAVEHTIDLLGGIDILVINTGGPRPGAFDDCDDSHWAEAFENTLMNVVRLARLALPGMRERRWGRIVNIASISAKQPIAGLTLSNALRPAILGLAKSLADEVAPDGVTVNTLCPGMHATDRLLHLRRRENEPVAELHARLAASIPVGRVGDPSAFADAAAFLCSQSAGFVTGTTVVIDGGAVRGIG